MHSARKDLDAFEIRRPHQIPTFLGELFETEVTDEEEEWNPEHVYCSGCLESLVLDRICLWLATKSSEGKGTYPSHSIDTANRCSHRVYSSGLPVSHFLLVSNLTVSYDESVMVGTAIVRLTLLMPMRGNDMVKYSM